MIKTISAKQSQLAVLALGAACLTACGSAEDSTNPPASKATVQTEIATVVPGAAKNHRQSSKKRHPRPRCTLVSSSPATNSDGVAVGESLELTWSQDILPGSLSHAMELVGQKSGRIAVSVEAINPRQARITPHRSLYFADHYTLQVKGVRSTKKRKCQPAAVEFSTVVPEVVAQALRPAKADSMARSGDYVFSTSRGFHGIQVYDASEPGSPSLVTELHFPHESWAITVHGERAYVASLSSGVLVLDISDPLNPVLAQQIQTPGSARDVVAFAQGGREIIAVADLGAGVHIFDVTSAAAPTRLSTVLAPAGAVNEATALSYSNGVLAVANGAPGFYLLDVTNPAAPEALGGGVDSSAAIDVELADDFVYVSFAGAHRIHSYDIANPSLRVASFGTGCNTPCVETNARLTLGASSLFGAIGKGGFREFALDGSGDATDGSVRFPVSPALSVLPLNDFVYVGEEGGLAVFDRSFGPMLHFDTTGHGMARGVAIGEEYAYVASSFRGLQVFDLTDPERPSYIARADSPGGLLAHDSAARSVLLDGDIAILADGRRGTSFYDISNPIAPTLISTLDRPEIDQIVQMALVDDTLYECEDNRGFNVVDIADARNPIETARVRFADLDPTPLDVDSCRDLVVSKDDGVLYMAGRKGLMVVELDTLEFVRRTTLPAQGQFLRLLKHGKYLFATVALAAAPGASLDAPFSYRLKVFDLSNPRAPRGVFISSDLGALTEMALARDILFVGAAQRGVYIFDVSTPSAPKQQLLVPALGRVASVRVSRDALYVGQSEAGLGTLHTGRLPF